MRENFPVANGLLRQLKQIDRQLACLVLLTADGTKPLSRWEKALSIEQVELLKQCGLEAAHVRRTVLTGSEVVETIFGAGEGYIEVYKARWEGQPIDKSAETIRFEGFLFGYPPCCVEAYIANPYAPNGFDPEAQKCLFHWACRGCKITPLLLPLYRRVCGLIANCG